MVLSSVRSLYLCELVWSSFQQYARFVGIATFEQVHILAQAYWEDRWCIFSVDLIVVAID